MLPSADALHLLDIWSKALGLEEMQWDDEGVIELAVESSVDENVSAQVFVTLERDNSNLLLSAQVLSPSYQISSALFRRILATNSKLHLDCGAWLALIPGSGGLSLLQRICVVGMEYAVFETHWLHFLDLRDQLASKLPPLANSSEEDIVASYEIPLRFNPNLIWV